VQQWAKRQFLFSLFILWSHASLDGICSSVHVGGENAKDDHRRSDWLNVLFYGFLFFGSSAASFKDLLSSSTSIILVLLFWVILLYRANQLWPR